MEWWANCGLRAACGRRHVLRGSSIWIETSQIDSQFSPHRFLHLSTCLHVFVRLLTRESKNTSRTNLLFSRLHIVINILSFSQCQNENECFSRRGCCRPRSGTIEKYIARLLQAFQARFDHLEELKPLYVFFANPFNVDAVGDGCLVGQPFVITLSAVKWSWPKCKKIWL